MIDSVSYQKVQVNSSPYERCYEKRVEINQELMAMKIVSGADKAMSNCNAIVC